MPPPRFEAQLPPEETEPLKGRSQAQRRRTDQALPARRKGFHHPPQNPHPQLPLRRRAHQPRARHREHLQRVSRVNVYQNNGRRNIFDRAGSEAKVKKIEVAQRGKSLKY